MSRSYVKVLYCINRSSYFYVSFLFLVFLAKYIQRQQNILLTLLFFQLIHYTTHINSGISTSCFTIATDISAVEQVMHPTYSKIFQNYVSGHLFNSQIYFCKYLSFSLLLRCNLKKNHFHCNENFRHSTKLRGLSKRPGIAPFVS